LLNFLERESLFLTPSRVILHQNWNSFNQNFDADVALLMMQREIQFSQFIKPICLFQITDLVANIRDGWIVSYGITSDISNLHQIFPRKLRIPIIDSKTCLKEEPRYFSLISSRTFCAGSKSFSKICQSDLGSGLFVFCKGRFYLAGIASVSYSNGYQECDNNNVAIFSNVHLMGRWINEQATSKNQQVIENETKNLVDEIIQIIQPVDVKTQTVSVKTEEKIDVRLPNFEAEVPPNFKFQPQPVSKIPATVLPATVRPIATVQPLVIQPIATTELSVILLSDFAYPSENSEQPTFDPTRRNFTSQYQASTIPPPPTVIPLVTTPQPYLNQAACGVMSQANGLIQGGSKAAEGQFPWAAAIFRKDSLVGNIVDFAVGSLISYRHVFVEALMISLINNKRIIFFPQPDEIQIFFGFDDLSLITEQSPSSKVKEIIVHPKYILGLPIQANIAIIILKDPVEYSKRIFPVCLWDSSSKLEDVIGKNVFGFGYGGQSVASTTKFKKFIVSKIKESNECPADYKFILRNVKDRSPYFCAGGGGESLCVGDSASVYLKKNNLWYLFAAVAYHDISIRTKVCNGNKPAMFEHLGAYIKWIQNIVLTM
jgi:Trypsin